MNPILDYQNPEPPQQKKRWLIALLMIIVIPFVIFAVLFLLIALNIIQP